LTEDAPRDFRARLYEHYFTRHYGTVNRADDASYESSGRALRQFLLPHLPTEDSASILDVACGIGYAVEMLQKAGFRAVAGIDLSPEQVEVARERGLPVEQADVFSYLAAHVAQFDVVLALDFVEHLDRDELLTFFDLVRGSLREGGRIILKTANASSLLGLRMRHVDLTHELAFTEQSLKSAFLTCGLRPIVITGERFLPFTVKGWIRWPIARLGRALWKAYLVAELGEEGLGISTEFNLVAVAERS
jgi:2-polyprenyl-3-methyl-5-hydroxy-6-metoxy-1,4-benzoquinol methylase